MASQNSRLDGSFYITETLSAKQIILPGGTVADAMVQAFAGLAASKLEQQYTQRLVVCDTVTNPVATQKGIHAVYGTTGEVVAFGVWAAIPAGAASSISVDLKKDGVSILAALLVLDSTVIAYDTLAAGFLSTALVQGDKLEVAVTALAGINLPKGVVCELVVREDAQ